MKLINDIIFKTYLYFHKKDKSLAITRTLGFITLLEASLIVPLFAIINGISSIYKTPAEPNSKMKYYIGIPLYLILTFLNNRLIKSKLKELNIPKLYDDYLVDGRIKYRFYCKFRGRIVCKTSYLIGIKDFEVFFMSLAYYAYK
jgi:hypothetical protein